MIDLVDSSFFDRQGAQKVRAMLAAVTDEIHGLDALDVVEAALHHPVKVMALAREHRAGCDGQKALLELTGRGNLR
ncbi:hypothetical protein D3C86_1425860 [compost metagenome]